MASLAGLLGFLCSTPAPGGKESRQDYVRGADAMDESAEYVNVVQPLPTLKKPREACYCGVPSASDICPQQLEEPEIAELAYNVPAGSRWWEKAINSSGTTESERVIDRPRVEQMTHAEAALGGREQQLSQAEMFRYLVEWERCQHAAEVAALCSTLDTVKSQLGATELAVARESGGQDANSDSVESLPRDVQDADCGTTNEQLNDLQERCEDALPITSLLEEEALMTHSLTCASDDQIVRTDSSFGLSDRQLRRLINIIPFEEHCDPTVICNLDTRDVEGPQMPADASGAEGEHGVVRDRRIRRAISNLYSIPESSGQSADFGLSREQLVDLRRDFGSRQRSSRSCIPVCAPLSNRAKA